MTGGDSWSSTPRCSCIEVRLSTNVSLAVKGTSRATSSLLLCFVLQHQPLGFLEHWAHFAACQGSHGHHAACWWRAELMVAAEGSLDYRDFMRLKHQLQLHAAVRFLRGRGLSRQATLGGKWGTVGPVNMIYTGLIIQEGKD